MTAALAWLAFVLGPPLAFLMTRALPAGRGPGLREDAEARRARTERMRSASLAAAAASLLACVVGFFVPAARALHVGWPLAAHPLLGESLLRVSVFSMPLLVLPSGLWLVTIAVTPTVRLDDAGLRRTAAAALTLTLVFLTESPALLVALWAMSNRLFLGALTGAAHGRARRVARAYLGLSFVSFAAGVPLAILAHDKVLGGVGIVLVVLAVLVRKGIFPFHAWIPEVFDTGRIGPIVRFSAPQLGAYVAVVLVVPHASPTVLRVVAVLSLITSVYGAALAITQREARRACGYLFVSQSALVLAGLDCTTPRALAGSLVLWLSSALAFTGLARTVLALEARRGRLDLSKYHGGYEQMRSLAASFLVIGLACTGFPGTLGFVGHEMLIEGAVEKFPVLGFLAVIASGFTGIAILRMYFSLFCGRKAVEGAAVHLSLRRREAWAFGAAAVLLVVSGFVPSPVVVSRLRASRSILVQRVEVHGGQHIPGS